MTSSSTTESAEFYLIFLAMIKLKKICYIYQFNIACSNTGGGVSGGLFYGTIGKTLTLSFETPTSGTTYTCTLNFS